MTELCNTIRSLLTSDFERELFDAALANLNDETNKLRFNNFAYSLRELSRHFLYSLAPDDKVMSCEWYRPEKDDGLPTRGQRIFYAVQGGISNELLEEMGFDTRALRRFKNQMLDTIYDLSKYTHIEPEVFNMREQEVKIKSRQALEAFAGLVEKIEECRKSVFDFLDTQIQGTVNEGSVYQPFVNLDELAPHYSLDEVYVGDYHISDINNEHIIVDVEGNINVTLEWGSRSERAADDGLDVPQSFPFNTRVYYTIGNEFPKEFDIDEFDADTSEWWEGREEDYYSPDEL